MPSIAVLAFVRRDRHSRTMVRRLLLPLVLVLAVLPTTWLRSPPPPHNLENRLHLEALPLPSAEAQLGPFRLAGAWALTSPNTNFGGYSALVVTRPDHLLAFSDRGFMLEFAAPGQDGTPPRIGFVPGNPALLKKFRDIESASRDPASGQIFIALEGRNIVARHGPDLRRQAVREVPEMRGWRSNSGPEAMARLGAGRFVVLCECSTGWLGSQFYPGLLFPGDPTDPAPARAITLQGVDGYRPTDMALLPDGRLLVLVRRLLWPVPARFAAKILLADPATIASDGSWQAMELADLSQPLPVDNFEGLAIESAGKGRINAWLISDENGAISQRVLLWKLALRLADLPPKQKAPGNPDASRLKQR